MPSLSGTEKQALGEAETGERLLAFLRTELGAPALTYAEEPWRLTGGYDTDIFAFALRGVPLDLPTDEAGYTGPLILRIMQPGYDSSRALREKAIHDTVTGLGYVAPRVLFATSDTTALGAAFLIMERIAGKPLLEAQPFNMARVLAEAQVRLHALPAPASLTGEADDGLTVQGYLCRLNEAVMASLPGLRAGMEWLYANVPPSAGETVICHGDFHPMNILSDGKQITGVVDWPNAILGPPQLDVGSTLVIARFSQPANVSILERVLLVLRPVLARRYLGIYRKLSRRKLEGLETYEALACMRNLVDEGRRAVAGDVPGAWDRTALVRHFRQLSGVDVSIPERQR
jgi:aminoglycoside phosphotransferase (APT) family kinase protein